MDNIIGTLIGAVVSVFVYYIIPKFLFDHNFIRCEENNYGRPKEEVQNTHKGLSRPL